MMTAAGAFIKNKHFSIKKTKKEGTLMRFKML